MKKHLPDFNSVQVLVYGDVMLDRYWHGNTNRISPEAPVPVVHVQQMEDRAGGAGNVALNLASLGAKVTLFAPCGNDEAADILQQQLNHAGVMCQFCAIPDHPTITKLRVLSVNQQLLRLDFENKFAVDLGELKKCCIDAYKDGHVLILSDYAKGALTDPQPLIQAARAQGLPVIVDPKLDNFEFYRGATLITPNFKEFQKVAGPCKDEDDLYRKGMELIRHYELGALLVTQGSRGMTLLQPGKKAFHLPARSQEVFDVTGAGDTVVAVCAAGIGAGLSFEEAVRLANLAAGLVVSKLGAAQVEPEELHRALTADRRHRAGILAAEDLLEVHQEALTNGEVITVVSGEFDILQVEDIEYLTQLQAQGDRLLICVVPGKACVNSVQQRLTVLSALQMVDWVVPMESIDCKGFLAKTLQITPAQFAIQKINYAQLAQAIEKTAELA